MDFNNIPSQSSQIINPTQQSVPTSQTSLQDIQALTQQRDDANIVVDEQVDIELNSSESGEETDEDETDDHREQFNLQIQQSAWHSSWLSTPIPNACVLSMGRDPDEVDGHVVGGEFKVGQRFSSKKELKDAIKGYSVSRNQSYVVKESKTDKYIAKCKKKSETQCTWRLRAVRQYPQSEEFTIVRYLGPHTCSGQLGSMEHVNLSSEYVSEQVVDLIREDPSLKIKVIIQLALEKWGYQISYRKAWIAKQKAVAKIYGDWEESYQVLQRWMVELMRTNSGSVVQWCTIPTNNPGVVIFQRVFWAFRSCILGFSFCRPLITIDSTHLYGKYKGCLLVAMAVDANNQLLPLAFAVVESENNSSWSWFISCLRNFILKDRDDICVIFDRHKSILNAIKNDCPNWIHRYCLGPNVGKYYGKNYGKMFKRVARQRQEKKFVEKWNCLIEDPNCVGVDKYLTWEAGPVECWSIHLDGGHRYGVITNNFAEVYNSLMRDTRALPIAALVQLTFFKTNSWFVERFEAVQHSVMNGDDYLPNIPAIINDNLVKGGYHKIDTFDRAKGIYSVTTKRGKRQHGKGGNVQIVRLMDGQCSCSKWQIYHLSCSHVLCACRKQNLNMTQFVDSWYKTENYNSAYARSFRPIPDEAYWFEYHRPKCIADQKMLRGKGRPKSTRYKNEMDREQSSSSSRQKCNL